MKYNQPYGVSDPNAPYVNGNPSTGTMGSIPPAASIEYPQREIVNMIGDAGMDPTDTDLHQLAKAIQSGQVVFGEDGGTVNNFVLTLKPAVTALIKGMVIVCLAATTNTGPSTVKVNGLAPLPVVHATDGTPLTSFDVNQGQLTAFAFDGAKFQQVWTSRTPGAPVYLTGPRDYYVDGALGSDANDGTTAALVADTIHGPFKTIQKAFNQVPLFNLNNWSIAIHIADHTYEPASFPRINGSGLIYIYGNHAVPGNVVVSGINASALWFNDVGGRIYIDGIKVQASGSQAADAIIGLIAIGNTTIVLDAFEFGPCVGAQMTSQRGALITNTNPGSNWRISGGCPGNMYVPGCFAFAYVQGNVVSNANGGPAITITVPITYNYCFMASTQASFTGLTYTALNNPGFVTGKRFDATYNSSIVTGSANINYYPGTIAGTQSNGGYYT